MVFPAWLRPLCLLQAQARKETTSSRRQTLLNKHPCCVSTSISPKAPKLGKQENSRHAVIPAWTPQLPLKRRGLWKELPAQSEKHSWAVPVISLKVKNGEVVERKTGLFFFFFGLVWFLINLFYFWLHWVFVAVCGLSLVVSWGYSSLQCLGFSSQWLLLLRSTGSRRAGFSSCGTRAQ